MRFSRFLVLALVLTARPVLGHEFWIEPAKYVVAPGDPLVADLRNGEMFEGVRLAWFGNRFTRFEVVQGDTVGDVTGRMGDTPALQVDAPDRDGLAVILHETTPSTLTYRDWDKFLRFAKHKDFPDAATDHQAAGWSQAQFRESYTRHAKALVAIGSGAGADRSFGMATEFVALVNPYEAGFDGQMRVRLLYEADPRADAQVEIFARAPDGAVTVSLARTDADGVTTLPVLPGHDYLLDAVVLEPAPEAGTTPDAPVWRTVWAALTFAVPG